MTGRVYDTSAWKRLRKLVLTAEPLCRMCAETGKATLATVVDHVEPVSAGGAAIDPDNLQSLCKSCHDGAKTEIENTGRIRGCDVHGVPLDPNHHWNQ